MELYEEFLHWLPSLLILGITIFVYIAFRPVSVEIIRFILDKLPLNADEGIATTVYRPGRLVIAATGLYSALNYSPWSRIADLPFIQHTYYSAMAIAFYWIVYNCSTSTSYVFDHVFNKDGKRIDPAIAGIMSSFFHFVILFFAVATVLSTWGFNISGFIAGLSIGGLAVSLAAKDSLANVFACLVILMDQPFHVGDWIICNNIEGVVESISFRSTNVRTFGKALVYIPNAQIINTPIQNFTNRDRRRIDMTLGVTYDTTPEQMKQLVQDIKDYLYNEPDIFQDGQTVAFSELAASSLDIKIYCFTKQTSYHEYMKVREKLNLALMDIVEKNGTSCAFPSTSVYVEKIPGAGSEGKMIDDR